MKLPAKILFFATLLLCNILYPQNITDKDVNEVVHGIIYQGNQQYLVTNKGYIKINNIAEKVSENDKWRDYYRKIYGDSTIQNPNTIIEHPNLDIPINFFIPIKESWWFDKELEFSEEVFLYDFIEYNENGEYIFRPGIIGIIGRDAKRL